MSPNQPDPELRFYTGKYQKELAQLILILQFSLGTMFLFMTMGFIYLTLGAVNDPDQSITHYTEMIPGLLGAAIAIYCLDKLYY